MLCNVRKVYCCFNSLNMFVRHFNNLEPNQSLPISWANKFVTSKTGPALFKLCFSFRNLPRTEFEFYFDTAMNL